MPRQSPVHYIAPSSISITPNANSSFNDIAVFIAEGAKIKVYSPRAGIDMVDNTYQEWTLTGRNRRLADNEKPYTIYARLSVSDKDTGYLVFAPKIKNEQDQWVDKYPYIGPYNSATAVDGSWYVRLGDVSLPGFEGRTVSLDTGILGTDDFNTNWVLNPDASPLRVELGCTIDDEDAGPTPYVYWGQSLILNATLLEGWTGTDIDRFDHWEITRNTGDAAADNEWKSLSKVQAFRTTGSIILTHERNADDFNGAVATIFNVIALERKDTAGDIDNPTYQPLVVASINIHAETVESYELSLSSAVVTFNPQTNTFNPSNGVNVRIRATDQRGDVFELTNRQYATSDISVSYAPVETENWTDLDFEGADDLIAVANIPTEIFATHKSLVVRIVRTEGQTLKEVTRSNIAFLRDGEDSREREWIFFRSAEPITFGDATSQYPKPSLITVGEVEPSDVAGDETPYDNTLDGWVPKGWRDEQQGVDESYPYEYGSYRDYVHGGEGTENPTGHWGSFSDPRVWNRYATDAITYDIIPDVSVINANAAGVINSNGISIRAYQTKGVDRSGNILPPTENTKFYAEYSVDDGAWVRCSLFTHQVYGVPPESVNKTQVGISIRLKNDDNPEEVLKESPPIKVVRIISEDETVSIVENYANGKYLSKTDDDEAQGRIGFVKGLWIKAKGLFGFSEEGDVTARTLKATGTDGSTTTDADYSTQKELGLEVTKSGVIGGMLRVAQGLLTTAMQSLNFSGSDALTGTGWQLTDNGGNGRSRLIVDDAVFRGKVTMNQLEVRKLVTIGGNYAFSPASGIIEEVDYYGQVEGEVTPSDELDAENDIYYYNKPFHLLKGETITAYSEDKVYIIEFGSDAWHVVESSDGGVAEYYARADEEVYLAAPEGMDITYTRDRALLGYEYVKVPWVIRLIPLSILGRYLSRKKWVRSTMTSSDYNNVTMYRCWLKADDGSTRTINTWKVGMLARCQTFDANQIDGGSHTDNPDQPNYTGKSVHNKLYWRAVVATAEQVDKNSYTGKTIVLEDGRKHNYIDLSNYSEVVPDSATAQTTHTEQLYLTGSDHASAGDNIVCFGSWLDRSLSNIITIETVGDDAPAFKEMFNIGYHDGYHIKWAITDADVPTRISPIAGNRFTSPEFIVQTPNGSWSVVNKCYGFTRPQSPKDGDVVLLHYTDLSSDDEMEVYDETEHAWNNEGVSRGDLYADITTGHVWEATQTGWVDKGIDLAKNMSVFKVDIDGIHASITSLNGDFTALSATVDSINTRVGTAEGNISTLQQTANGITAEVSAIKAGKNMLSGVLTGTGWKDENLIAAVVLSNDYISVDTSQQTLGTSLISPSVAIVSGKKYTLSFEAAGTTAVAVSMVGSTTQTLTTSAAARRVVTFTASASESVYFSFPLTAILHPQLELGESATAFDAGTTEQTSMAKLTANRATVAVTDGLSQTGVDILNGIINLFADKVKFYKNKSAATSGDAALIWIDSQDGSLHAVNGHFEGTVEATTLKGKVTSTGLEIYDGNNNLRVVIKPQSISSVTFDTLLKMFIGYDGLTIGKSNGTHATFADSGFEFLFPPYEDNENTYISPIGGLKFSTKGVEVPYQYPSGSLVPSTFVNYNGFQSGIKVLTEEDFGEPTTIRYSKTDAEYNVYVYTAQAEDTTLIFRLNGTNKTYFVCLGDGAGGNTNVDNNTLFPKVGRKIRVLNASYQGWTSQRDLYVVGGRNIAMNNGGNSADGRIKIPVGTMWEFTYLDTYSPAFIDGNPYRAWLCVEIKRNS